MTNNDLWEYKEEVINYLEYIGIDEYLGGFNEVDVAKDLKEWIVMAFMNGMSPRKTAILFWSYTINYQVLPKMEEMKSKNKVN